MSTHKKKAIGLILDRVEETYQYHVWVGIHDFALEHDCNLFMFIGNIPKSLFGYELNYKLHSKIITPDIIDGIIIMTGGMGDYYSHDTIQNFCDSFDPIPRVSISLKMDRAKNVLIDNKPGMRDIVTHLIKDHNLTKIAFVKGPEGHDEADERFEEYKKVLLKNNIIYDENIVIPGNFSYHSGLEAVKILLDERKQKVEAIVAVDDDTALGIIEALQKRNITIPDEIAITGFDDTEDSQLVIPPLTTVRQPFYEQGEMAGEMMLNLLNKKEVDNVCYLEAFAVKRESCGCLSRDISDLTIKDHTTTIPIDSSDSRIIDKLKFEFLSELTTVLNAQDIKISNLDQWIDKLMDILFKDTYDKDVSDLILHKLNSLLIEFTNSGGKVELWQYALTTLRNKILQYLQGYNNIFMAEYIFHKARILINEALIRFQALNKNKVKAQIWNLKRVTQAIITALNHEELIDAISGGLECLGIKTCFIALYESIIPFDTTDSAEYELPEYSAMYLAIVDGKIVTEAYNNEFMTKEIIPEALRDSKRHTYIFMPLCLHNEQFGYIIFEHQQAEATIIYETLRGHISNALKGFMMHDSQLKSEEILAQSYKEIESLHQELQNLSVTDDLTGLYNKRGFYIDAEKQYEISKRMSKPLTLFTADIDNLEDIISAQDVDAGLHAIQSVAKILARTFRKIDLIGRVEHNKFYIITLETETAHIEDMLKRLENGKTKFNKESLKPYKIELNIGHAEYDPETVLTFKELCKKAENSRNNI